MKSTFGRSCDPAWTDVVKSVDAEKTKIDKHRTEQRKGMMLSFDKSVVFKTRGRQMTAHPTVRFGRLPWKGARTEGALLTRQPDREQGARWGPRGAGARLRAEG